MTLERFRELASAYGAKLERWPERERASANALLMSSLEAQQVLFVEGALDNEFSLSAPPELDAAFERKLAEIPVRNPQRSFSPFKRWLWAPLLGWSVAAALGLVLGAGLADSNDDTTSGDTTAQISSDDAMDALALGDIADIGDWEGGAQ